MNERWIHVTARTRGAARLDDPELAVVPDDPSIPELAALAAADRHVVITGGEPSLRADLPALLQALPRATLRTDGLALASAVAMRPLRDAGLGAVRVMLHAAQPAAHDWLVGAPGAAKRAMRALQLAADAGLRTEIEAIATRSNAAILPQLVELAERLRVRAVRVRRIAPRGAAAREPLAVAFGLLEDPLAAAHVAATRGRIALTLHDFPRCAFPKLEAALAPSDAIEHAFVASAPWAETAALFAPRAGARCAACPGGDACAGVPVDGGVIG